MKPSWPGAYTCIDGLGSTSTKSEMCRSRAGLSLTEVVTFRCGVSTGPAPSIATNNVERNSGILNRLPHAHRKGGPTYGDRPFCCESTVLRTANQPPTTANREPNRQPRTANRCYLSLCLVI